jgi:hypothetical protein
MNIGVCRQITENFAENFVIYFSLVSEHTLCDQMWKEPERPFL